MEAPVWNWEDGQETGSGGSVGHVGDESDGEGAEVQALS